MAKHIAFSMSADVVSLLIAVLSARVRQDQRGVLWLVISTTETKISRQRILCISEVAVWTGPRIEGEQLFSCFSSLAFILLFLLAIWRVILFLRLELPSSQLSTWSNFLFLDIIKIIDLFNPPLDAAKMKWLTTLVAVPKCTPLINWIMTNNALLSAFGQTIYKVNALLCQVLELIKEIGRVILNFCFFLGLSLSLLILVINNLDLLIFSREIVIPAVSNI